MKNLKFKETKKENNQKLSSVKLYKGVCVKIKNSKKIFQVIGINPENKICWLREWPFASKTQKTFPLEVNQITLQLYCSNEFFK